MNFTRADVEAAARADYGNLIDDDILQFAIDAFIEWPEIESYVLRDMIDGLATLRVTDHPAARHAARTAVKAAALSQRLADRALRYIENPNQPL
ncbi:MAG: hypothetical protein H3C27_01110 [Opitutaceae bacterium]|nr:hypothetical protein [Opitutaceae bacterium]